MSTTEKIARRAAKALAAIPSKRATRRRARWKHLSVDFRLGQERDAIAALVGSVSLRSISRYRPMEPANGAECAIVNVKHVSVRAASQYNIYRDQLYLRLDVVGSPA